jgi:hypothetical protein
MANAKTSNTPDQLQQAVRTVKQLRRAELIPPERFTRDQVGSFEPFLTDMRNYFLTFDHGMPAHLDRRAEMAMYWTGAVARGDVPIELKDAVWAEEARQGLSMNGDQPHAEEEGAEHPTDLGNARRLVQCFGEDLRYCHEWHQWLIWDGTRWCPDRNGEIVRRAKQTVQAMYAEAAQLTDKTSRKALVKWALSSESDGRLQAMMGLLPRPCEILLEEGIWGFTPSQTDKFPFFHAHSASEDTAK